MRMDEEKIGEAKDLLIRATKILSDLLEERDARENNLEDWMKDRVELWCRLYNEGGIVSRERLHEIWREEMKKDVRGLGGFFVGKGASLAWTPDESVVLTKNASEAISAWTGKSISEYAKQFKTKK